VNKRELLISRLRGLEAEYTAKEDELTMYPELEKLIVPKLNYIAEQYEKWEAMLHEEVDNNND
jgi:hypothetical protein